VTLNQPEVLVHHRLLLPALLALCLSAPWALAQRQTRETFSGKVVSVTDGDTLGVLRDGREVKIRLHGIDAPEIGQAFGDNAKRFASSQVYGKTVSVRVLDRDRYGRFVGVVTVGSGPSLNEALVKDGLAWWYHQYGATERALAEAEIDARAARRGLWKDSNPTPPWAFRHPEGQAGGDGSRPTVAGVEGAGPATPPAPIRPVGAAAPAAQGTTVYATRTGSKYHRDGCRNLRSRIAVSLEAARGQGLTPCNVCRP
jgi:endonuclease YncB( thermonuclease family)